MCSISISVAHACGLCADLCRMSSSTTLERHALMAQLLAAGATLRPSAPPPPWPV